MLGMDMAYIADTRGGRQAYHTVTGDGASFGARPGESVPLEGTYCQAVLKGRLPSIVRDATTDPLVRDLEITQRAGIGSYIGVPVTLSDGTVYGTFCCLSHEPEPSLRERDVRFMGVLARLIADQLERDERTGQAWLMAAAASSVRALLAALEARDGYTEEHSQAVVEMALAIGRELGLDDVELIDLRWAALLHDVGKIGISDAVLRKPAPLNPEDWEQMRRHPAIGERIVAAMPPLAHLAPVIRGEHERWDGQGYPDGLRGEQIPAHSRIILVSDAYHAMTSHRPYRDALTAEQAIDELVRHTGTQFCPTAATAAVRVLRARATR
jgi:HD-GYP domain-containing protein (c-di-GMP phosphodiesterase class II)